MTRSDLIDVNVDYVHDTMLAWLVLTDSGAKVWVPKSACEFDRASGVITLSRSLAEEKGLV